MPAAVRLVGRLALERRAASLEDVVRLASALTPEMVHELGFDDVVISEYITFMEVMDKADIRFFLQ